MGVAYNWGRECDMGTFKYSIEIGDPEGERYETVEAVVDTRASYTLVPASVLARAGVRPIRRATFVVADGRRIERNMGQTWIRVDGEAVIRLVIFGDEYEEPLLGADTLEGLLLGVDPVGKRLAPTTEWLVGAASK